MFEVIGIAATGLFAMLVFVSFLDYVANPNVVYEFDVRDQTKVRFWGLILRRKGIGVLTFSVPKEEPTDD